MSKSIIEKLGIRRLEVFSSTDGDGNIKVRFGKLVYKEKVFDEMLEALINVTSELDKYNPTDKGEEYMIMLTTVIEKACHPKKWEEIKGLINGQ